MKRLLIMKTGSTLEPIRLMRGDFEGWFQQGLGVAARRLRVVDVQRGQPLPDPGSLSGVVVTGSPAMVSHRAPWSEAAAGWLRRALDAGLPVLGVCFGHQLLAHALGGEVAPNPLGLELGTVEVQLTPAGAGDPLLGGLPSPFLAQASHVEAVLELPRGATLLGRTARDPCHAFSWGPRAWGVQFHPECDAAIIRGYLDARREAVLASGQDPAALAAAARDSVHGRQVLRRFAALVEGGPSLDA